MAAVLFVAVQLLADVHKGLVLPLQHGAVFGGGQLGQCRAEIGQRCQCGHFGFAELLVFFGFGVQKIGVKAGEFIGFAEWIIRIIGSHGSQ